MGLNTIKNLIFDLGGVIIDLDFQAAYQHFADLSGLTVKEVIAKTDGLMLFLEYEKGLVTSEEFRRQMRVLLEFSASDDSIDRAWCAMLGGIPQTRLQLLKSLKQNFRTFALSNTNDIHVKKFNSIVEQSLGNDNLLSDHFEKIYFSHQMNMRKPEVEIYQAVLSEQQLLPEETLFIDDNHENIVGAASLGIQTFHLLDPDQLITYFNGAR